jgi:cytochrome oxidase Cu insertion factor (SCO1/SenC/PrrC family)
MRKNILFVIFIAVIFIVPFCGAWYFYQHHQNFHLKTVNHGELIQPLLTLSSLPLETPQGKSFSTKAWQDKWVIVLIAPPKCEQNCQQVLYYMRQVRIALGKNQDQLLRAYVSIDQKLDAKTFHALQKPFAGTEFLKTSSADLAQFLKQQQYRQEVLTQGQLFIVDPHGYVMMHYPLNFEAKDLLADLTRLLQVN